MTGVVLMCVMGLCMLFTLHLMAKSGAVSGAESYEQLGRLST